MLSRTNLFQRPVHVLYLLQVIHVCGDHQKDRLFKLFLHQHFQVEHPHVVISMPFIAAITWEALLKEAWVT